MADHLDHGEVAGVFAHIVEVRGQQPLVHRGQRQDVPGTQVGLDDLGHAADQGVLVKEAEQAGHGKIRERHLVVVLVRLLFAGRDEVLIKGQRVHEQELHPADREVDLLCPDHGLEQGAGGDDEKVRG